MSRVLYASVMRSLMFPMIYIIPNIAQAVGTINRYMENPSEEH